MKILFTIALLFSGTLYTMHHSEKHQKLSLYEMVTTGTPKDVQQMHKLERKQNHNNEDINNPLPRIEKFIIITLRDHLDK